LFKVDKNTLSYLAIITSFIYPTESKTAIFCKMLELAFKYSHMFWLNKPTSGSKVQ